MAEGPSFQLEGFISPITEKQEGATGVSQHNLALADTTRLNRQPLFKRALRLDERDVYAQWLH